MALPLKSDTWYEHARLRCFESHSVIDKVQYGRFDPGASVCYGNAILSNSSCPSLNAGRQRLSIPIGIFLILKHSTLRKRCNAPWISEHMLPEANIRMLFLCGLSRSRAGAFHQVS
ncbi:hypothetical protein PHSY_003564 [Pseudozyma hubeiensis SY62]|uniref:Uncharacterized protein n=1 Tax=Pseudozyma hubeiensis (strain SY62) TaxID=1305764 RepID=R9P3P9_PSEHS|nr:hypothetical protein PHSY_003564 [Pseudozyma hubeiensis SY62]GAC95986.1 hypothetical protein PHSY_003564 [Pseudozyma hubeiensis SY62]